METIHILLIIIAIGAVVGSIPVYGFTLESLGVLLTGMAFGAYGYKIDPIFMDFGLALFIYGVALQIGPGFVEGFRKNGLSFGFLAVAASGAGMLATFLLSLGLHLPMVASQGILAGTFNNAIALASTGLADNAQLFAAFGTVYPVAFVLTMVFVVMVPRLLRVDLAREAQAYFEEQDRLHPPPETRVFLVKNPGIIGKTLAELNLPGLVGTIVCRIIRDKAELPPSRDFVFAEGDLVEVVGDARSLDSMEVILGQSYQDRLPRIRRADLVERRFLVTNKQTVGKSIGQLGLQAKYHATITRIRRGGVDIPVRVGTVLAYGDRISLVTPAAFTGDLTALFGNDLQAFGRQDLYPVLLGMAVGALVGMISIGGFKLGLSGGVLLVGIVAGRMGKIGPVVFTITAQANHVLKRLGLILFMAALGTTSGDGLLENLASSGAPYVLVSAVSILAALAAVMLLARFAMKRSVVEVMAICAGSVACTPAMEMATAKVGRDDAMVLYASIYPMGLMMPVFFMQLLTALMRGVS